MKKLLSLIFTINSIALWAQQKNVFDITTSAGYNNHSYTYNIPGWYFKMGLEKRIGDNFQVSLRYWHSNSSNFPKNMHVYSFQKPQEDELITHFLGLTEEERSTGKGSYMLLVGDVIGLSANYHLNIKKFYIAPKLGFNFIKSKYIDVGLHEAYFDNQGRTIGGKIGYDIRASTLNGWSFGLDLGYKLNNHIQVFIDLEDIRDRNGQGGYNYYEAKTLGAGIKYSIIRK
ncbi:MAG: hypothetical protein M3004_01460 [Bacteroidota bacterium]|nr:hypothetical protein [Bacteroidota bacterium]